mmetsp:Transcript_30624/g.70111  ORF Transcript_30624/g.70111 Transcript_30624/m.70111 type:complete len:221 (-) Transcript_30624:254-916(-)
MKTLSANLEIERQILCVYVPFSLPVREQFPRTTPDRQVFPKKREVLVGKYGSIDHYYPLPRRQRKRNRNISCRTTLPIHLRRREHRPFFSAKKRTPCLLPFHRPTDPHSNTDSCSRRAVDPGERESSTAARSKRRRTHRPKMPLASAHGKIERVCPRPTAHVVEFRAPAGMGSTRAGIDAPGSKMARDKTGCQPSVRGRTSLRRSIKKRGSGENGARNSA